MNPALAECIPFLLCALAFAIGVVALVDPLPRERRRQDQLDAEFWRPVCHCDECEADRAVFRRAA